MTNMPRDLYRFTFPVSDVLVGSHKSGNWVLSHQSRGNKGPADSAEQILKNKKRLDVIASQHWLYSSLSPLILGLTAGILGMWGNRLFYRAASEKLYKVRIPLNSVLNDCKAHCTSRCQPLHHHLIIQHSWWICMLHMIKQLFLNKQPSNLLACSCTTKQEALQGSSENPWGKNGHLPFSSQFSFRADPHRKTSHSSVGTIHLCTCEHTWVQCMYDTAEKPNNVGEADWIQNSEAIKETPLSPLILTLILHNTW